ncbi:MAG: iron-containing alcohol dehydrogenase [Bacillota bacterium]
MFVFDKGFDFDAKLNIRFRPGAVKEIGKELKKMGFKKALVVTDPGVLKAGLHNGLIKSLVDENIEYETFSDVEPNPRDISIEKAAKLAKELQIDVVIGIGGGSSLDTAKGVGFLLTNPGRVKDYNGKDKVKNEPIPIIAIPTTAGTGSEVTANAAITDAEDHVKMSVRSPKIIPSLAVLDPELLATLPQKVAAYSSMDALIHAIESYLSRGANAFSDFFNLKAIELISKYIRPFCAEPSNIEAAGNMLIGSMLAGLGISNTGTGNAHALGRALGGEYDMAHGLACSVVFPHVMKFNAVSQPDKYVDIAKAMGLITDGLTKKQIAEKVVEEIFALMDDLKIEKNLNTLNVKKESFERMAQVAISNVKPNPRKTTLEDLVQLFNDAY